MTQLYDLIGIGYSHFRRPDPRIASSILDALSQSDSVVNVGAGTGSYEPSERRVVAVEPSLAMIRQRAADSAPVVQGCATQLPFRDESFDAALAILTVHHWPDLTRGLRELVRVARRRIVILTIDPATSGFWLSDDYFPAIRENDRKVLPPLDKLQTALGEAEVRALPVPHDCVDGFQAAYWRRPHAYLDPGVRGAMSAFSQIDDVESGLARLRSDLADGTWEAHYRDLFDLQEIDLGYRIVIWRR